jgi:hypothetical protein
MCKSLSELREILYLRIRRGAGRPAMGDKGDLQVNEMLIEVRNFNA